MERGGEGRKRERERERERERDDIILACAINVAPFALLKGLIFHS